MITFKDFLNGMSVSGEGLSDTDDKAVDGHPIGSKAVNEDAKLYEASFVSSSPSTGGSRGVEFDVKKNEEKSVGTHVNGQPKEHHDVYHEGKHVGHVSSYSGYQDKKSAGSRIVSSRKDVKRWAVTVYGGEHNRHGSWYGSVPENSQYTDTGFKSKKEALQQLANAHKSNT